MLICATSALYVSCETKRRGVAVVTLSFGVLPSTEAHICSAAQGLSAVRHLCIRRIQHVKPLRDSPRNPECSSDVPHACAARSRAGASWRGDHVRGVHSHAPDPAAQRHRACPAPARAGHPRRGGPPGRRPEHAGGGPTAIFAPCATCVYTLTRKIRVSTSLKTGNPAYGGSMPTAAAQALAGFQL